MAPLGVNYRVFLCSVQSPELRLTLLRERLFVCLVQSPRLWLTAEEIGFLDYDSIFACLVQSPRLWLTLVRENIIFCLVQSPRLWRTLLNELSMDDSYGEKILSVRNL